MDSNPRTYAHVEDGRVRELYVVPPIFEAVPIGELFPSGATWLEVDAGKVSVGDLYDGGAFSTPPPPPAPIPPTKMSPLKLFGRFKPEESAALYGAATQSPAILGFLLQASAAQEIDLTDPRLQVGLFALVAAGLIPATRATEILTP